MLGFVSDNLSDDKAGSNKRVRQVKRLVFYLHSSSTKL